MPDVEIVRAENQDCTQKHEGIKWLCVKGHADKGDNRKAHKIYRHDSGGGSDRKSCCQTEVRNQTADRNKR